MNERPRPGYERAGSQGFDPYKDGRASFNYMTVPAEVLEEPETLRDWACDAIGVAREAAASRPSRRPRKRSG